MVTSRFPAILILLLAGFATACWNSHGTADGGGDIDTTVVDAECPAPLALSRLDDVLPLLGSADDWVTVGPYGWSNLPVITPDLQATTDLLLDATSIAGPAWCTTGCRSEVRFQIVGTVPGVAVEGVVDDDYRSLGDRPLLRVAAGAVFRLRPVLRDCHPSPYTWVPILEVRPPCTTSCAAEDRRCPADLVCYPADEDFCLYCETRPASECACVGMSTGGECMYAESGDMLVMGHCAGGTCVSE
jgi:hypothetical protein